MNDYTCPNCDRLCVNGAPCTTCTENFPFLPHPSDMTPEERAREMLTYTINYVDYRRIGERIDLLLNREWKLGEPSGIGKKLAEEARTAW